MWQRLHKILWLLLLYYSLWLDDLFSLGLLSSCCDLWNIFRWSWISWSQLFICEWIEWILKCAPSQTVIRIFSTYSTSCAILSRMTNLLSRKQNYLLIHNRSRFLLIVIISHICFLIEATISNHTFCRLLVYYHMTSSFILWC